MRGSRSGGDLDSAVRALIGRSARPAAPRLVRDGLGSVGLVGRLTGEFARRRLAASRSPSRIATPDRGRGLR